MIGYRADPVSGGLTNATALGANATVNASNKVRIGDANVTVIEGQVGFTSTSDRTRKEHLLPVDGEQVLAALPQVPVYGWNFIGQDPTTFRHCGPSAQDLFVAFGHDGLGTVGSPTTITWSGLDGRLLAAVQALGQRTAVLQDREEELIQLRAAVAEKDVPLAALQQLAEHDARLAEVERLLTIANSGTTASDTDLPGS